LCIKFICLGFRIVFIGDNVNLAAHLCDTAYKNNFSEILVNDDVKNNCTKCEVGIENEKFSEWLTIQENVDDVPCYGGSFVRVNIQKKKYCGISGLIQTQRS